NAPAVRAQAFDDPSPAERFQPPHMGFHIAFNIATRHLDPVLDYEQVEARLIKPAFPGGDLGNVAVAGAGGHCGPAGTDQAAHRDVATGGFRQLQVMNPTVDAVDDQMKAVLKLIPGQALA